jgi:hypothetical protein
MAQAALDIFAALFDCGVFLFNSDCHDHFGGHNLGHFEH